MLLRRGALKSHRSHAPLICMHITADYTVNSQVFRYSLNALAGELDRASATTLTAARASSLAGLPPRRSSRALSAGSAPLRRAEASAGAALVGDLVAVEVHLERLERACGGLGHQGGHALLVARRGT